MLTTVLVAVVALAIGIFVDRFLLNRKLAKAQEEADRMLAQAQETIQGQEKQLTSANDDLKRKQEALEEEKEKITESRRALKRSQQKLEQRHDKINRRTQRVNDRESALHKAAEAVDALRKETDTHRRNAEQMRSQMQGLLKETQRRDERTKTLEADLERQRTRLDEEEALLAEQTADIRTKLERIAGMTQSEAIQELRDQMVEEARTQALSTINTILDEAKLTANRKARKVILTAIQRTAASHAIENTVSVVNIQSDEMKGRIIGREGRNIRAFEAATGIEVIVDDTPEAVILSGFDPVRREVARIALTKLIQDGRIHPARIEEVVEKCRRDMEEEIMEIGERTVIDMNLHGLHADLIRLVGRMRYRTSYGQNLLAHSIETARVASLIAAELGLDAAKARRAGLLHDIGKVVEEEIESPHAIVGMELCRKYKEDPEVCNAVGAHHDEIEMTSLISPIVQAADAISGARPGARREALEAYIKRLENLEKLASSFKGVERVYAIQAGREIRVLVNHSIVSDDKAEQLAMDISKKIQDEMQYPGQIKITVIRELRAVSYAK